MGTKITRQRYNDADDKLAVEICFGNKHIGEDILTPRYQQLNEGKYLVSPVDAVNSALKIYKKWDRDYHDERKFITLVNGDENGGRVYLDPTNNRDIVKLEKWAQDTLLKMSKCGHCQCILGKTIVETADLPNRAFCSEQHYAFAYKIVFGKEPARVEAKKKR